MNQRERKRRAAAQRSGECAGGHDVAARGLDVERITLVIN